MVVKMHLRFIQIVINSVTIVLGIIACITEGAVSSFFDSQCVLNAKLHVGLQENTTVITVFTKDTIWGDMSTCNFTTFTPAVGSIHAFIWCWFFLLMRGTLKENGKEMSILLPSAILHFVMFIVVFVACIMLTSGFVSFCQNLESALKPRLFTCAQIEELDWRIPGNRHHFYTDFLSAKVSLWLMLISILLQCVSAVYGIFKILKPPAEASDTESIKQLQTLHSNYASSYSLPQQNDLSGSVIFTSSSENINKDGGSLGEKSKKKQQKQKKSKKKEISKSEVDVYIEIDQSENLVDV